MKYGKIKITIEENEALKRIEFKLCKCNTCQANRICNKRLILSRDDYLFLFAFQYFIVGEYENFCDAIERMLALSNKGMFINHTSIKWELNFLRKNTTL